MYVSLQRMSIMQAYVPVHVYNHTCAGLRMRRLTHAHVYAGFHRHHILLPFLPLFYFSSSSHYSMIIELIALKGFISMDTDKLETFLCWRIEESRKENLLGPSGIFAFLKTKLCGHCL